MLLDRFPPKKTPGGDNFRRGRPTRGDGRVRQLSTLFLGRISRIFKALPRTRRAICSTECPCLVSDADWLIGACNLMLCPIHGCRQNPQKPDMASMYVPSPVIRGNSAITSGKRWCSVWECLPKRIQFKEARLAFNTADDGYSLGLLYARTAGVRPSASPSPPDRHALHSVPPSPSPSPSPVHV